MTASVEPIQVASNCPRRPFKPTKKKTTTELVPLAIIPNKNRHWRLNTKKAQPTAAQSSFLPPENIWSALRAAKQKTAQNAPKIEKSLLLVSLYDKARTYFEENCWKLQGGGQRPPHQKNNSLYFLNFTPAEFLL